MIQINASADRELTGQIVEYKGNQYIVYRVGLSKKDDGLWCPSVTYVSLDNRVYTRNLDQFLDRFKIVRGLNG